MKQRLKRTFFQRDIRLAADELIGKLIVRKFGEGEIGSFRITEIEIYIGEEDLACHAAKGRTKRTEVMYLNGGLVYVYLIYGMYWMFNIVCGPEENPQAILVRSVKNIEGPGRLGRKLKLDERFYGEDLEISDRIWIEDDGKRYNYSKHARINIDYADEIWKNKAYRFRIVD